MIGGEVEEWKAVFSDQGVEVLASGRESEN